MVADHSPAFLALVQEAKQRILECTIDEIQAQLQQGDPFYLVDVREDSEWAGGHIAGAIHLGKGILERDIETRIPDKDADIVVYCGGGYRSALAADNLQKMGYRHVRSMDGGIRAWRAAGYAEENS
ncbi:MAG: sulfurtransferase [Synechococcaceae cyanobacterium RM1_1_27]|nr:sulfurtransferase [Synechococcaceae cyanobacterium SM2_3_2]NJO85687.1 sulfurtransferase [Synechococcaceae cyanobacterium RM1_1_27]